MPDRGRKYFPKLTMLGQITAPQIFALTISIPTPEAQWLRFCHVQVIDMQYVGDVAQALWDRND